MQRRMVWISRMNYTFKSFFGERYVSVLPWWPLHLLSLYYLHLIIFQSDPCLDRISAPQREKESPGATNLITHWQWGIGGRGKKPYHKAIFLHKLIDLPASDTTAIQNSYNQLVYYGSTCITYTYTSRP